MVEPGTKTHQDGDEIKSDKYNNMEIQCIINVNNMIM